MVKANISMLLEKEGGAVRRFLRELEIWAIDDLVVPEFIDSKHVPPEIQWAMEDGMKVFLRETTNGWHFDYSGEIRFSMLGKVHVFLLKLDRELRAAVLADSQETQDV